LGDATGDALIHRHGGSMLLLVLIASTLYVPVL
jgi:hypothetical protein